MLQLFHKYPSSANKEEKKAQNNVWAKIFLQHYQ